MIRFNMQYEKLLFYRVYSPPEKKTKCNFSVYLFKEKCLQKELLVLRFLSGVPNELKIINCIRRRKNRIGDVVVKRPGDVLLRCFFQNFADSVA